MKLSSLLSTAALLALALSVLDLSLNAESLGLFAALASTLSPF